MVKEENSTIERHSLMRYADKKIRDQYDGSVGSIRDIDEDDSPLEMLKFFMKEAGAVKDKVSEKWRAYFFKESIERASSGHDSGRSSRRHRDEESSRRHRDEDRRESRYADKDRHRRRDGYDRDRRSRDDRKESYSEDDREYSDRRDPRDDRDYDRSSRYDRRR